MSNITIFEKVDAENPDANIINKASDIIKNGGLVAFPTETVYGLGADGLNPKAVKKIYQAKGRPSDNPLILHISSIDELYPLIKTINPLAKELINVFWPGPLTIIFEKSEIVPLSITSGLDTVAIRFPVNKIARAIIKKSKTPIAAPSANSSGKPSPTRASHVKFDLDGKIDMIIDGGACEVGLESTVIDVTQNIPTILRPGAITKEMIESVVGKIDIDKAIIGKPDTNLKPKAPGMKYKHYSPKAKIIIVDGKQENVIKTINDFAKQAESENKKIGIMATTQTKNLYDSSFEIFDVGDRNNLSAIASNLFKMFRKFDFLNVDIVYAESFEENNLGLAIMNRLKKAAGYNIIKV